MDYKKLGQFASTHNQSWLHTGALYSLNTTLQDEQMSNTVRECRKSFQMLRSFCIEYCPDAIYRGSECLFLFETKGAAGVAKENLNNLQLMSKLVSRAQIQKMEPILSPMTKLQGGVLTDDIAFNSYRILTTLAIEAWKSGGLFHSTATHLTSLKISFNTSAGVWLVNDGSFTVEAPTIVCAAGALIPHIMRERLGNNTQVGVVPDIQKCLVAVLHQRICSRIIAVRSEASRYLNLVPYESGTTLNAGQLDEISDDFRDTSFPSSVNRTLGGLITLFVPGIVNNYPCGTHFYVCQKLANTDQSSHPVATYGRRHYFWIKEPSSAFFYFYPGKFTLAPVAARELTKVLIGDLQKSASLSQSEFSPMDVAHRPYWGIPSHSGYTRDQTFIFDPVIG